MWEGLALDLEAVGSPGQSATQCPSGWHLWQTILGDLSWFGQSLAQCPTCLQIRHLPHALSFKDSGFAIGLPCRAASIWACLVSLLFSLSWALASLSCSLLYKGIGGWTISYKEAAGFCCYSCRNFILLSDVHWDRNLSFKITCPS